MSGMIEQRVHAGLCNRMKEMASAIALSRAAGQPLVVYWLKNRYLNCGFGSLFEPIEGVRVVNVETSRLKSLLSLDSLTYRFKTVRESADLFLGNSQIEEYRDAGVDLVPLVAKAEHTVIITYYRFMAGSDTLDDFRPRKDIQREVDTAMAQLGTAGLVGVHIRGTDNAEALEKSPVMAFVDRMRVELQRDPQARFFLATDDPDTERTIAQSFPERVVTRPKVFARDNARGVRDALVDLLLLSRCRLILGSHWSSFTETAAEIGGIDMEIVGK
jgi:hypothetical protein